MSAMIHLVSDRRQGAITDGWKIRVVRVNRFPNLPPMWLYGGDCRNRLRKKLLVPVPLSQIRLGVFADVLGELVAIVFDSLGVFHDLVGRDRIFDIAGRVRLNVGGSHLTGDQHGLSDD